MRRSERDLMKLCERYGLAYYPNKRSGHFTIYDPETGARVATAAGSPGGGRAGRNLLATLRAYRKEPVR